VSTTYPEAAPAIGDVGESISVGSVFDGWGYVHLFAKDGNTLTDVDTYAIPEAHDPDYAFGYGDLSVHEVATDPTDADLAYLSYYAGGVRAVQIQCANPADTTTCELVEVGGYINPEGSNFWGVEVWTDPSDGQEYILASDRDRGLVILRDP
jgi:hypothetical protein